MLNPHPCSVFLTQFLAQRTLTKSTGKPIYTYKTSQREYEALKTLLATSPPADSTSACFVLFATEWWRRNYSGGHWEWEPIFNEIGRLGWNNHARREAMMTTGCRFWGRQIFQHDEGPNSLLGTVFFESGLPLRLLTKEGYINELIHKAFSFLQTYQTRPEDTVACIRDLVRASQLPGSLNVDLFFKLIYDVIHTLLQFKTRHQLGGQEQPLMYLNQYVPNWREELPLRIDDDANARAFLDSLLVDVARMVRQETSKIGLTYALIRLEDGWKMTTTLSIPDGFHNPAHLQLDETAFNKLSAKVQLKIVTDSREHEIGFGFKSGTNQLSISGLVDCRLPADIHTDRWHLLFTGSQLDEQVRLELPYSDGLDPQLPWVFTYPENKPLELAGVGSVRLSTSRALVVCPTDFVPDSAEGTVINRGRFSDHQSVYELTATCSFQDLIDHQTYRIKLSESGDDPYYIALHPQSNSTYIRFCQKQNAGIFLGFPRLRRLYKLGGHALPVRDRIQYKTYQHPTWQDVNDTSQLVGRFKIRSLGPENEVLFSREITVLPVNFSVRFDAARQQILLDHVGAFGVGVQSEESLPESAIVREGTGYRIQLQAGSQSDPIRLRLTKAGAKAISLYVPYPAAEGYFMNGLGHLMTNNQTIDLQQLYGTQLVLNNLSANSQTARLSLTLNDRHNQAAAQYTISKKIKIEPFSTLDLSLIHYKSDIEGLLSYSRAIDAVVRIQYNGGKVICIAQYTAHTQHDYETDIVTLTSPAPVQGQVRIKAFPLSERFSPAQLIDLEWQDQGWHFPEACPAGGKWFYFSTSDSALSLRPSVAYREKSIPENTQETVDEIHEASNHSYENRQAVLIDLFDRIAHDFSNVNWATLQQLRQCTAHLPFTALDVWKALIGSEKALVAFFLRFDSPTIHKLTLAFSVNWNGISVQAWLAGCAAYRAFLPESVADMVLNQKIQELETGLSLNSVAQIIRVSLLNGQTGPEFQMCQNPQSVSHHIRMVIEGGYGIQGLIHKHNGHTFPILLQQELIGCFNRLPGNIRQLIPDIPANFRYVRPVIYLPVVMAYQTICPDDVPGIADLSQHQVRQIIDFDEDYFNLIYNLTQAFCWFTFTNA